MEIAHELCEYVNDLDFQDLPEEVIDCTKKVILDTVASAVAGSSAPGIETLTGAVREWGGRPESSIIVLGDKVPAPNAVLINATMARARDIDEVHEKAVLHCAITVVPPGLALGSRCDYQGSQNLRSSYGVRQRPSEKSHDHGRG